MVLAEAGAVEARLGSDRYQLGDADIDREREQQCELRLIEVADAGGGQRLGLSGGGGAIQPRLSEDAAEQNLHLSLRPLHVEIAKLRSDQVAVLLETGVRRSTGRRD